MRHPALAAVVLASCAFAAVPAGAQEREPRIGPFVVDVRGAFPKFPDNLQLADSRGLNQVELPGLGIGLDLGVHVYLFKWRAITFGVGGEGMASRAHFTPAAAAGQAAFGRPVTERFATIAPQISFNFGTGRGWSYISGGVGNSVWSVVPDGAASLPADRARLRTFDYGGGARWFAKRHLAFTFDVRIWAINPGIPAPGLPGSPRTALLVLGAGVSVR
ncbi:MAG: hypothetical protein ACM3SQ_19790 [Betaproteobacteria bacterium]